MPKYELAIAVVDELDHTPGLTRKKEGDIICILPYPTDWGRKVIDEYFIVIVETDATLEEMKRFQCRRLYRDKKTAFLVTQEDYEIAIDPETGTKLPTDFEMAAKSRYVIPFSDVQVIAPLDMNKVRDKQYIYQPFKKASEVVKHFDGKNSKYLLTVNDVDCAAGIISAEQEFSINLDTLPAIIFDKYENKKIKPLDKVKK